MVKFEVFVTNFDGDNLLADGKALEGLTGLAGTAGLGLRSLGRVVYAAMVAEAGKGSEDRGAASRDEGGGESQGGGVVGGGVSFDGIATLDCFCSIEVVRMGGRGFCFLGDNGYEGRRKLINLDQRNYYSIMQ